MEDTEGLSVASACSGASARADVAVEFMRRFFVGDPGLGWLGSSSATRVGADKIQKDALPTGRNRLVCEQ